jgi:hypothetical protein
VLEIHALRSTLPRVRIQDRLLSSREQEEKSEEMLTRWTNEYCNRWHTAAIARVIVLYTRIQHLHLSKSSKFPASTDALAFFATAAAQGLAGEVVMGAGNLDSSSSCSRMRRRFRGKGPASPRTNNVGATTAGSATTASNFVDFRGRPRRLGDGGVGDGGRSGDKSFSSGEERELPTPLSRPSSSNRGSPPPFGTSDCHWPLDPAAGRREREVQKLPKPSRGTCSSRE